VRQSWIENLGRVSRDALPQNPVFQELAGASNPCNCRKISSTPRSPASCVPGAACCQRKSQRMNCARRDRLNLLAQFADGEPVDAREQTAFAPFRLLSRGVGELAAKYGAAGFQAQQRFIDLLRRKAENFAQFRRCRRPRMRHPAVIIASTASSCDGAALPISGNVSANEAAPKICRRWRRVRAHPICAAVAFGGVSRVLPDQFREMPRCH